MKFSDHTSHPRKSLSRSYATNPKTAIGAGLETTAWALSIASYYIIANPLILQTIRAELSAILSSATFAPGDVDWLSLKMLLYLIACMTESICLYYGVSYRKPRIPHTPLKYKEWIIPAGTPVEMNIVDIQHDESIFPDSLTFLPE